MIRQPELEQIQRLSVKTLDQVFITRAQEGLSCSLFEAQAFTDLVREVYFPWLAKPEAVQAGQLAFAAIKAAPITYTQKLAAALAPQQIRVNAISRRQKADRFFLVWESAPRSVIFRRFEARTFCA